MPAEGRLTREAFLSLAKEAGLDVNSPHLDELYPYVLEVLASLDPLSKVDVAGAEPDLAFLPSQG